MSHDAELVDDVAEAISAHAGLSRAAQEDAARAVLDALDLPGRERRAKAEALREHSAWLIRQSEIEPLEGPARGLHLAGMLTKRRAERSDRG